MSKERKGPMGGHGHGMGMGKGEKAKDFKGTMKKLISYLKPYALPIILVFIFAIASAAFSIVGPKILGRATTEIFNGVMETVQGVAGGGIDFTSIANTFLPCFVCISLFIKYVIVVAPALLVTFLIPITLEVGTC